MNNSIYKKLISDMMLIIILPVIAVITAICVILCVGYYKEQKEQTELYASEYAARIRNEMISVEDKSESIMKYAYISNNITKTYRNNYERLEATVNISSYLESAMGKNVVIYVNDGDIFRGQYLRPISDLKDYGGIREKMLSAGANLYWDDLIYSDENEKWFLLYRQMPLNKNSIMVCKAYVPGTYTDEFHLSVSSIDEISKYDISKKILADFYVTANLDYKNIYTRICCYIILFLILGALFAFALMFFTKKAIKRTTQSIDSFIMNLKSKDILASDFDVELRGDEFMELAVIKRTISSLARHIKQISDSAYETELQKKRTELEALQNRIDPHLLYNSLTVLKLNAIKAKDENAINIVDNLVSYYRAVLSKGREYSAISEEIDMLKKYVSINEISNGKKYEFHDDIPEELKNCKILHLMLQPFVENSFVHGFGGRRENCKCEIKCYYENGYLKFEICDNGYGIDSETLLKLNNLENYKTSYGIKNTYIRMKLEYGEESKIIFESEKNVYTKVMLSIPYKL